MILTTASLPSLPTSFVRGADCANAWPSAKQWELDDELPQHRGAASKALHSYLGSWHLPSSC
eukprot:12890258-Prorocentrum_lima.AAC.1